MKKIVLEDKKYPTQFSQALAKLYGHFIGREINPNTEVLVTVGAYQSLYNAILGHVDEGDEVIIFEPFYDW